MTASERGGDIDPIVVDEAETTGVAAGSGAEPAVELPAAEAPPADRPGSRLVSRTVVGVGFAIGDAPRDVDCIGLVLEPGDRVLVETARDPRPATVLTRAQVKQVDPRRLRRVIRRIQDSQASLDKGNKQEQETFAFCQEKVREYKLPMKLVRVEIGQGGARLTFHFASEERVDFRNLVRELARRFHARIEMRQIGVRDQAKLVGGLGMCGRELCCCSWIQRFAPVSIRMAKDQGLALNPQKVSGVCGRLLCCLNYEEEIYKELRVGLPKVGKRIQTPSGEGRVRDVDVLRGNVRVSLESGMKEFTRAELCQGCDGDCPGHKMANRAPASAPVSAPRAPSARPAQRPAPAPAPDGEALAADAAPREGARRSRRGRRRGGGEGRPEPGREADPTAPGAPGTEVQAAPPPPRPAAAAAPAPSSDEDLDETVGEDTGVETVSSESGDPSGAAPRKRRRRRRRRKPRGGEGGGEGGGEPSAEPSTSQS
ncbi:MAG: regulatory iron-sulfur-containing complex subunit RicT [Pseudomonadota bacterium]